MRLDTSAKQTGWAWVFPALAGILLVAGMAVPARGSIPENAAPSPAWASAYNGPSNFFDGARTLVVSPDGNSVFVTGGSSNRVTVGTATYTSYDFATVAYDASSGALRWVARYDGPAGLTDFAFDLAVSPDGSTVFVTGESEDSDDIFDYATIAYSASDGSELWIARFGGGPGDGNARPTSLALASDGSAVFVTGCIVCNTITPDYNTVAYETSSGVQLWVARYNGPGNVPDFARDVAVSPDGSKVFVTGRSGSEYGTVAYSVSSGAQDWVARYKSPSPSNEASALAVSPDGLTLYVTGDGGNSSNSDYGTVAYTVSSGAQLWSARYNGPGNSLDEARGLSISPDGSKVFVTGVSVSTSSDYATVAHESSSGALLWVSRYNGPGNSSDSAYSIVSSPDGSKVFVTGRRYLQGQSDYATVAYTSTGGAQLWASLYSAGTSVLDRPYSIGVSPNGTKVFVTGERGGDYLTLAYRGSSCESGEDEVGPVSSAVNAMIEPNSGQGTPYAHGINCDVIVPAKL